MIKDKIKEWYDVDNYSYDTVIKSNNQLSDKFKELEILSLH